MAAEVEVVAKPSPVSDLLAKILADEGVTGGHIALSDALLKAFSGEVALSEQEKVEVSAFFRLFFNLLNSSYY